MSHQVDNDDLQESLQDQRQVRLQLKQTELNRMGALGSALLDELQDQIEKGAISEEIAREVINQFDIAYAEQLHVLQHQPNKIEGSLEANLDMYRFFDDTADLELSNVKIKYSKPDQTRVKQTDKMFIKAFDPDAAR